jgi:hypothetical protein
MTPQRQLLVSRHLPDPSVDLEGESALLPTLVRWLVSTGRLRDRTHVAYEVPWLGRRVDLALLTGRGVTTAYELKIGRLSRALEQAAYNRQSFNRSWVVTGNRPKTEGLAWAAELGVGLLVIQHNQLVPLVMPTVQRPHASVSQRLRSAILVRATRDH